MVPDLSATLTTVTPDRPLSVRVVDPSLKVRVLRLTTAVPGAVGLLVAFTAIEAPERVMVTEVPLLVNLKVFEVTGPARR